MTKQCNSCLQEKEEQEFYIVKKRKTTQIYHLCKLCCKEQKQLSKEYYRAWELKKKYGISLEEYKTESLKRKNKCDICSKQVDSLHVDHNHSTGLVRGYLCGSCNRGIGLLQDSPSIIMKAYKYLNDKDPFNNS